MIRVVLRHIDQADGTYVGDFPPSEINQLVDHLAANRIYIDDVCEDGALCEDALQWTITTPETSRTSPHVILEILIEGD